MEIHANREHDGALTGLEKIRSILSSREGSFVPTVLFDLDDTIKEKEAVTWGDGRMRRIYPETVAALSTLRDAGLQLGIATEQAVSEIVPFLTDIAELVGGTSWHSVFNGVIVAEGGGVVIQRTPEGPVARSIHMTPYTEGRVKLMEWLKDHLSLDEWKTLPNVDKELGTVVQMPPKIEQGEVTISIFERGEHIGINPEYISRYEVNRQRILLAMEELKISNLDVFEAGNGTIRIVPEGRSKASIVGKLSIVRGISLKDTVYFCDGPNDVTLAKLIKSKGGGVVAVGNAVKELHAIADYSAQGRAGLGVSETVQQLKL